MEKPKSTHCGFGLCPKKYKYLANPALLDKVFSNQVPRIEKIAEVKRPWYLEEEDIMHTTQCSICNEEVRERMMREEKIKILLEDIKSQYLVGYFKNDLDFEAEKWGQIQILEWILSK